MISCKFENDPQDRTHHFRHVVAGCIVTNDEGRVLLVKRSQESWAAPGYWALAGGFIERDESIAGGAIREVLEETGYHCHSIGLLRIATQNFPGNKSQNIQFVYILKAGTKVEETDGEIDESRWFELDKLPPNSEIAFDHAEVLEDYKKYLKGKLDLPIILL